MRCRTEQITDYKDRTRITSLRPVSRDTYAHTYVSWSHYDPSLKIWPRGRSRLRHGVMRYRAEYITNYKHSNTKHKPETSVRSYVQYIGVVESRFELSLSSGPGVGHI